jgi:hypothetical protein
MFDALAFPADRGVAENASVEADQLGDPHANDCGLRAAASGFFTQRSDLQYHAGEYSFAAARWFGWLQPSRNDASFWKDDHAGGALGAAHVDADCARCLHDRVDSLLSGRCAPHAGGKRADVRRIASATTSNIFDAFVAGLPSELEKRLP